MERYDAKLAVPFAVLGISTPEGRVTDIAFLPPGAAPLAPRNRLAERVCRQVERYLDDPHYRFDLPFDYEGTPFQRAVWRALVDIPAGRTRTYGELARALKTAARAVGGACGANRIPIVIPCHRVVSAGGLGGFMNSRGGLPLDIKRWLLRHESE